MKTPAMTLPQVVEFLSRPNTTMEMAEAQGISSSTWMAFQSKNSKNWNRYYERFLEDGDDDKVGPWSDVSFSIH